MQLLKSTTCFQKLNSLETSNPREKLLQMVSHELKNPLAAFSLQTRVLTEILETQASITDREKLLSLTKNCDDNVKRMESILNRIIHLLEQDL